jgi:hypothetical protein
MKTTFRLVYAIVMIVGFTASVSAQRQTSLYIDDGHSSFSILTAPLGGGTVTLPSGPGTLFTPAYVYASATSSSFTVANVSAVPLAVPNNLASGITLNPNTFAFTVNQAGIYNIEVSVENGALTGPSAAFAIYVNGAPRSTSWFDCFPVRFTEAHVVFSLNANDVIQLMNESGGAITLTSSSGFSASLSMTRIQ